VGKRKGKGKRRGKRRGRDGKREERGRDLPDQYQTLSYMPANIRKLPPGGIGDNCVI